jgi:hypothetical protein
VEDLLQDAPRGEFTALSAMATAGGGISLASLPEQLREILAPFDKVNEQGQRDGIIDLQELATVRSQTHAQARGQRRGATVWPAAQLPEAEHELEWRPKPKPRLASHTPVYTHARTKTSTHASNKHTYMQTRAHTHTHAQFSKEFKEFQAGSMPISVFKAEHQEKLRKFDQDGGGKLDADVST